ncbi:hypothetical protein AKO1_006964 [Acrasis kona]|uniref:Uncharacterized protein n=1 Tax=Acrasis kona TaxID=1008807 RepID=A0AAW2YVD2_9EUKA
MAYIQFVFPPSDVIIANWEQQKEYKSINFRGRGMNDAAFSYLHQIIIKAANNQKRRIDLSNNALTNLSVTNIIDLSKRNFTKIYIEGNLFKLENLDEKTREYLIGCMRDNSDVGETHLHASIVRIGNLSEQEEGLALSAHKKANFLEKQIAQTSKDVSELTKAVDKLTKNVSGHQKNFDKWYKVIESKIIVTLLDHLSGFRTLNYEEMREAGLEFHETDVLLISEDGETIIIGEVKHEIVDLAYKQLFIRRAAIRALLDDEEERPAILKNAKDIICAIGAEIASVQHIQKCQEKRIMLVIPSGERYKVMRYDKQ